MKKDFIVKQNYIKELTIVEHIILWSNLVILLTFFITQLALTKTFSSWQTWLTFIAGIISIFSVMAGVKKKPLCPFLGIIGSALLAPIAWENHAFATMIMYIINFIVQIVSLITWIKNVDIDANIKPMDTKFWQIAIYLAIIIGLIALYTWIEGLRGYVDFIGGKGKEIPALTFRIFDSSVLMFAIGCFIPMIMRLKFVWFMYILNDIAQVALWIYQLATSVNNLNHWMMLVSVLGLLACSILGLIRWLDQNKKNKK